MTKSSAPPEITTTVGAEVVPETVTVSVFTIVPLVGEAIVRERWEPCWSSEPDSSKTAVRVWRMRLVDQTVMENRIPMRNPTNPAQNIDGPKRRFKNAGIKDQISVQVR